jgi:hypothetical protein
MSVSTLGLRRQEVLDMIGEEDEQASVRGHRDGDENHPRATVEEV